MTRTATEDHHRQSLDGLQSRFMDEVGTFLKCYPEVQPARVGAIVGQVYLAHYVVSYGDGACKAARESDQPHRRRGSAPAPGELVPWLDHHRGVESSLSEDIVLKIGCASYKQVARHHRFL